MAISGGQKILKLKIKPRVQLRVQLKEASNELQKQQGFYDNDGNYVE